MGEAPRDAQGSSVLTTTRLPMRADIDARDVYVPRRGQHAAALARGLGERRYEGRITHDRADGLQDPLLAAERRTQRPRRFAVLVDMPEGFRATSGLQVDVAVLVDG